jgi:putative endonuclease
MSRVSGKPYFVYVLWSQTARCFYVGISEDPEHRLRQHNESLRGWTARHRPWVLVHVEQCADFRDARRKELALKKQKGGAGFYQLTGLDPQRFSRGARPSGL